MISAFCILISHLFLLASCGQKMPPPPPARLSAQAEVHFGGKEITAQVLQQAPGTLEVAFSAPEELRGCGLTLQGDSATIRFGNMQTELPAECLPAAGFASLLCQVMLRLAQPNPEGFARARSGDWVLDGTAGGLRYRAQIAQDGTLRQVSVPAAQLEIILT